MRSQIDKGNQGSRRTQRLAAALVERLWKLAEATATRPMPAFAQVTDVRLDLTIEGASRAFAISASGPFGPGPAGELTMELVVDRVGMPDEIDRMSAAGVQYGMSLQRDEHSAPAPATVDGYTLELWFYGKHVIYLTNGTVSGRSLYATQPVRIVRS